MALRGAEPSMLESFTTLFYFCKLLGVAPHDWRIFREEKLLRQSRVGAVLVLFAMAFVLVCFTCMIIVFKDETAHAERNHLNLLISWVLTYSSTVMMATDQISAIRNQHALAMLFDQIDTLDRALLAQKIRVRNAPIAFGTRLMIAIALASELGCFATTYMLIVDNCEWESIMCVFVNLPIFLDSLDKIWYVGMLMGVKERFSCVNQALDDITERHEQLQRAKLTERTVPTISMDISSANPKNRQQQCHAVRCVRAAANCESYFGESIRHPSVQTIPMLSMSAVEQSELEDIEHIEAKFVTLTQLHDTICGIGRSMNQLWCVPLLIMMGYGFIMFTAYLYFLYCTTAGQEVPVLFRLANIPVAVVLYLAYLSGRSVVLMYMSWSTTQASKRTGVALHRCAVAANTNEVYEIVNHLSLKLLNHQMNFSARGLFALDMETLYAICGGITSYLIILIQFNIAAEQARNAVANGTADSAKNALAVRQNFTNYMEHLWYMSSKTKVRAIA